jgi:hypothetical protein
VIIEIDAFFGVIVSRGRKTGRYRFGQQRESRQWNGRQWFEEE